MVSSNCRRCRLHHSADEILVVCQVLNIETVFLLKCLEPFSQPIEPRVSTTFDWRCYHCIEQFKCGTTNSRNGRECGSRSQMQLVFPSLLKRRSCHLHSPCLLIRMLREYDIG